MAKTVFSIDKAYDELMRHENELSSWSRKNRSMFVSTRDEIIEEKYADMSKWIKCERHTEALEEF